MEVNIINKQKFLAELGRLLTFMYEEDRQTALAMYSKMFDDAVEEQALLQFLVSPTRQAVVLARSYDAKERKLQVHTQSREEEPDYSDYNGQFPPFILAIDDLQQSAAAQGIFASSQDVPAVDENQFSLFDDLSAPAEEPGYAQPQPEVQPLSHYPAGEEDAAPAGDPVSEFADAVDAFLADFSIAGGELIHSHGDKEEPREEEPPQAEEIPTEAEEDQQPFHLEDFAHAQEPAEEEPEEEEPEEEERPEDGEMVSVREEVFLQAEEDLAPATVRKARVFPLILYIILSIPITLLGVVLLLIPTLLSLSFAVTFVSAGVLVLTGAFAGFSIFADLMVILGLSLVLLAVGLLFTWLFIWFIGGAIAGLIRGVIRLGGKWCYKEVAVQ